MIGQFEEHHRVDGCQLYLAGKEYVAMPICTTKLLTVDKLWNTLPGRNSRLSCGRRSVRSVGPAKRTSWGAAISVRFLASNILILDEMGTCDDDGQAGQEADVVRPTEWQSRALIDILVQRSSLLVDDHGCLS